MGCVEEGCTYKGGSYYNFEREYTAGKPGTERYIHQACAMYGEYSTGVCNQKYKPCGCLRYYSAHQGKNRCNDCKNGRKNSGQRLLPPNPPPVLLPPTAETR